jgi:aldehyde dehydrogenase (NAD+)
VKRVSQELGGKSPNVILEGADLTKAVTGGVMHMFNNSGQSCNAPSRMIVPLSKMKEVAADREGRRRQDQGGDPRAEGTTIGPVVSRIQWDKIQALIKKGIDEAQPWSPAARACPRASTRASMCARPSSPTSPTT